MTTDQIIQTLTVFIPFSDDDIENDNERFLANLMDELQTKPDFERVINPIFQLIERYPHADFGNPGPLVHTLESKSGSYEDCLQQSLNRRPTPLTVWMLNRIINGEKNSIIRENLLSRLANLLTHPLIDDGTKEIVQGFIEYQNRNDES